MNDEELGLSTPKKYEGEQFSVLDYGTKEYADAQTLDKAIAIRGAKAFLRDVTPDDFSDDNLSGVKKSELQSFGRIQPGKRVKPSEM